MAILTVPAAPAPMGDALRRPPATRVGPSPGSAALTVDRAPQRRGTVAMHVVAAGALVAGLVVFGAQLRHADLGGLLADVRPGWVLVAAIATGLSLLAAAHSLTAFAPIRLRAADNLRAQLAICGLRIVAPSALSTPAIWSRYLSLSGLTTAQSLAVVGTAQTAQLLMTMAGVGALALLGSSGIHVPSTLPLAIAAAAIAVLAVAAGRVARVRRAQRAAAHAMTDIVRHLREHPLAVVSGLGASAALTLAHIIAFTACVAAVGGHASILALTGIYLGAASAGSLIPTPGGVGAVEAAMIAGLAATGIAPGAAAAAALLTRLLTVWLLVPPGWLAARSMRRRGLL
ncbi:MAG: lysylphosphatidylglycerol synthase domain-containing protein [Actinomycetota bacterium]|nr:lysylphosphatidylglycerol synthase domain-containing protein [Actinomycetota bacterium]